jgi:hypothetical protein
VERAVGSKQFSLLTLVQNTRSSSYLLDHVVELEEFLPFGNALRLVARSGVAIALPNWPLPSSTVELF